MSNFLKTIIKNSGNEYAGIASEGIEKIWLTQKKQCSSNFTTDLKNLLIVQS